MSLEAAIQENTAVMRELIAALTAAGALQAAQVSAAAHSSPAVQAVVKAQKEASAKKPTTATPDTAGDAGAAPAAEAAKESKPSGEPSNSTGAESSTELHPWHEKTAELFGELDGGDPTLENLRKAILGINSKIGRTQADAVLNRFGADAITPKPEAKKRGLEESQYPEVFELCLDVLSGRVDATLAIPE